MHQSHKEKNDMNTSVPENTYGIVDRETCQDSASIIVEQIQRLGFAVVHVGMSESDIHQLKLEFEVVRNAYARQYGVEYLTSIDEHNTMRMPLLASAQFRSLASNQSLHSVVGRLINGNYILNQQNGIINPPHERYNQAAWHRDLPYQHFVSSVPLAINALYCVDDFTTSNGATYVLPGSHLHPKFPSLEYVREHAIQVEAPAGSFLVLDCMLFHCGGWNQTTRPRRAVNHVFSIPYFKHQISMRSLEEICQLSDVQSKLFGVHASEPSTVEEYLSRRKPRY